MSNTVTIPEGVDIEATIPLKIGPFGFYGDLLTEGVWIAAASEDGKKPKPFVVAVKQGEDGNLKTTLHDFETTQKIDGREMKGVFPSLHTTTLLMSKNVVKMLKEGKTVDPREVDIAIEKLLNQFTRISDAGSLVAIKRLIEGTYFYDVFDHFPITFIYGVPESGKTRLWKTMLFASYHGYPMVDPTPASLFRTKEDEKITLGIDEAQTHFDIHNPIHNEMETLVNISYSKNNGSITRMEEVGEGKRVRKDHSMYGPVILNGTRMLPPITSTRTIRVVAYKVLQDYPDSKPDDFKEVRNQLYYLRLTRAFDVSDNYEDEDVSNYVSARFSELFRPLFVMTRIFGTDEEMQLLQNWASRYQADMRAEASALTDEEVLLDELWAMVKNFQDDDKKYLSIRELTSKFNTANSSEWHPKAVSNMLSRLGVSNRRKMAKGNEFLASKAEIKSIRVRLGLEDGFSGGSGEWRKGDSLGDGGFAPNPQASPPSSTLPPSSTKSTSSIEEAGLCAVCGKGGVLREYARQGGVFFLHPTCEGEWRGLL